MVLVCLKEMFRKRVAVRAVELSIRPFCTEFWREQLCDDDMFFGSWSNLFFFMKRVAMRAVELSIGAFYTEFRCEQLCDDDIFWIVAKFSIFHENGRRESCGALDLTILRRISVRTTL